MIQLLDDLFGVPAASEEVELPLPPGCSRRLGSTRFAWSNPLESPGQRTPPILLAEGAGRLVLAADDAVRIHDAASGVLRRRFRLSGAIKLAAATSERDALALVVTEEEAGDDLGHAGPYILVRHSMLWLDLVSGELRRLPECAVATPRFLAISSNRGYLAVAPADGSIEVLSLPDGERIGMVRLALPLDRVAFSVDGEHLEARASGNPNPTAELSDRTPWEEHIGTWELPSLTPNLEVRPFQERDPKASAAAGGDRGAQLPVGSTLLSAGSTGRWLALEGYALELSSERVLPLPAPQRPWAQALCLGISSDGATLLRGLQDGTVEGHSLGEPRAIPSFLVAKRAESMTFSPDANALAVQATNEPAPRLVNPLETDAEGEVLPPSKGKVRRLAFSPDGSQLAGAGWNGEIAVWCVGPRELAFRRGDGPRDPVALAWNPDGGELAVLGNTARFTPVVQILTLDHAESEELSILPGVEPLCLVWSPDGRVLFSGGDDGRIHGWDRRDRCRLDPVAGDPSAVVGLALGADGAALYASHREGSLLEWSLEALYRRMGKAGPSG